MINFKNLIKTFIALSLMLTPFLHANKALIEKTDLTKQRANLAFSQTGGGPERHRALITAYWVGQGDFILDIGAHIGTYSLFYRNLVGHGGLIIAYEASPPIYNYLVNRLNSLRIKNIIAKNKAVSNTTNTILPMRIYPYDIGPQCCTVEPALMNKERMPGNTAIVKILTEKVDDLLENRTYPPVRFIKIDTEGHEHAVIQGARQLLLEQRPLVIFEYGFSKGSWEPDTIRQMEEIGYVCYDCNTDTPVRPGYGDTAIPYLLTDLLAIPLEFEEEVRAALPYLH